jgi:transcriptional regulator GlxA family with amidase domain
MVAIIRCRLSTEQQQRLNELRDKLEAEMLTEAERTELLELIERVEAADVERAEALLAMAQKRGISVRQLMEDLELEPRLA